jgi:hypothetical protein
MPLMRALVALTVALGGVLSLPFPVSASVRADPLGSAYGATLHYIDSATKSCVGQHPQNGGFCSQSQPFIVTMRVLRRDHYRIEIQNQFPHSNTHTSPGSSRTE